MKTKETFLSLQKAFRKKYDGGKHCKRFVEMKHICSLGFYQIMRKEIPLHARTGRPEPALATAQADQDLHFVY